MTKAKRRRLRIPSSSTLLVIASVSALISLPLIIWSLLEPTVVPVMVSMSIGQGIGMLSFMLYLIVVLRDVLSRSAPERMQGTALEALRRRPTGEIKAVKVEPAAADADAAADDGDGDGDDTAADDDNDGDNDGDEPKGEGG